MTTSTASRARRLTAKTVLATLAITGALTACKSMSGSPTLMEPMGDWSAPQLDAEDYDHIDENGFIAVADEPLSTFSVDVDTRREFLSLVQRAAALSSG